MAARPRRPSRRQWLAARASAGASRAGRRRWFNRARRLSKDDEADPRMRDGMIYLASIRLMLRRLDRNKRYVPAA
jgi:transposase